MITIGTDFYIPPPVFFFVIVKRRLLVGRKRIEQAGLADANTGTPLQYRRFHNEVLVGISYDVKRQIGLVQPESCDIGIFHRLPVGSVVRYFPKIFQAVQRWRIAPCFRILGINHNDIVRSVCGHCRVGNNATFHHCAFLCRGCRNAHSWKHLELQYIALGKIRLVRRKAEHVFRTLGRGRIFITEDSPIRFPQESVKLLQGIISVGILQ